MKKDVRPKDLARIYLERNPGGTFFKDREGGLFRVSGGVTVGGRIWFLGSDVEEGRGRWYSLWVMEEDGTIREEAGGLGTKASAQGALTYRVEVLRRRSGIS